MKLKSQWHVYVFLAAVLLFVLAALWYTGHETKHIGNVHYQNVNAIEGVVQELSQAHIWLEEGLAGDDPSFARFREHMAEVDRYEQYLYQIKHSKEHHPKQSEIPVLVQMSQLKSAIQALRKLAEERIQNPQTHGIGSSSDDLFDSKFIDVLELAERIEIEFNLELQLDLEAFDRQQRILLLLALLLAGAAISVVIVADTRRKKSIQAELRTLDILYGTEKSLAKAQKVGHVGTWDWDPNSGALLWSDETYHLLGYEAGEIEPSYELFLERVHPDDREKLNTAVEKALNEHAPYKLYCRINTAKGEQHFARVEGEVEYDDNSKPERMLGIIQDVTERAHAERQLQRSEEQFRSLVEQSPFSIQVFSPDGETLQVNKAWEKLWGLKMVHLKDYNIFEDQQLVDKDVMPYIKKAFAGEVIEAPPISYSPERSLAIDGHVGDRWTRAYIYPVKDNEGTITEVILMHEDVTEKLQAEEAVKLSQERLADAQRIAHVGSWDLDLTSDELIWSDEIFRIFEVDQKIFGASYEAFLDAIHPEDRDKVNDAYAKSLAKKEPYAIEHRLLFKDGRIKYVNERCESFFDEQGKPTRSIGTVQDITGRIEAEQEKQNIQEKMEHVQRLESLGILAGGIAHDFNNILTAIMGNASLASLEMDDTSPAKIFLSKIESSTQRAADLCKQMLAYSGKGKFVVKLINLSELVEEMARLVEVSIEKNVVIKYYLAENLPAVEADSAQIQQVILNLITNANEAIGSKSGVISFSTGVMQADSAYLAGSYTDEILPEGRYVFVEVSDTGCGMDAETSAKVFDPFFTTKFTGRGLGMSAVLGIVRGHKGAIRIYSELGKGTTFKVLLPESSKALAAESNIIEEDSWRAAGTILIVDDEETIREVASTMLASMGFNTLIAENGVEALPVYRQHQNEIVGILLDMTMPKMDGKECFRELRRINPDVKVVLSSGYNELDATSCFVGQGLAGFIQKPYSWEELRATMKSLLGRKNSDD